jgi:hypothetical protein
MQLTPHLQCVSCCTFQRVCVKYRFVVIMIDRVTWCGQLRLLAKVRYQHAPHFRVHVYYVQICLRLALALPALPL